jgi:hypothetical protein
MEEQLHASRMLPCTAIYVALSCVPSGSFTVSFTAVHTDGWECSSHTFLLAVKSKLAGQLGLCG